MAAPAAIHALLYGPEANTPTAPAGLGRRKTVRFYVREGFEAIPTAFAEMLRGENFGKTLVRVAPDPTVT